LKRGGTKTVRTSIQAANMNAFAGHFVRSIKSECLDRMIFVGGDSLDRAIREFTIHCLAEPPHQGLDNAFCGSAVAGGPATSEGRVEVTDRLGGLLRYCYREAAQGDGRLQSSFRTEPGCRLLPRGRGAFEPFLMPI
jgi:hypothetical protein